MKCVCVFGGWGEAVTGGKGVPCAFSLAVTYLRDSELVQAFVVVFVF